MPGNNNEDIADEFATYMLMQTPSGPKLLDRSLEFWQANDSKSEADHIIKYGDRHSLSIQRIRNIKENLSNGKSFAARWNNLIYPHMTQEMLNQIISNPTPNSDIELARSTLKRVEIVQVENPKNDEKSYPIFSWGRRRNLRGLAHAADAFASIVWSAPHSLDSSP